MNTDRYICPNIHIYVHHHICETPFVRNPKYLALEQPGQETTTPTRRTDISNMDDFL